MSELTLFDTKHVTVGATEKTVSDVCGAYTVKKIIITDQDNNEFMVTLFGPASGIPVKRGKKK